MSSISTSRSRFESDAEYIRRLEQENDRLCSERDSHEREEREKRERHYWE